MVAFRKDKWETLGGIAIPSYYIGGNSKETPGQPPYTRGIHEHMYKTRLWTMRQYAGFGTAEESNERYKYLLDQGHKSIMHIAGPLTTAAGLNRFLGYEATMLENGIKDYKLRVANDFSYEDGYHTVLELVKRGRMPTGLFLSSDWMAVGAIRALNENGYKVPEDISVIGYDNIEFFKYNSPSLTTIAQNGTLIGEKTATLLKEVIEGKDVESIVLDVELIERESCKKIYVL
mgnify:CR=1 FL=1